MNSVIETTRKLTEMKESLLEKELREKEVQKQKRKRINTFSVMNDSQLEIYNEVRLGLKYYSDEDLEIMSDKAKAKIYWRYKEAQRVLNLWKQELVINYSNFALMKYNSSPKWLKIFNLNIGTDEEFKCDLSFKDLNVTRTDIIYKLIEHGLLPANLKEIR